MYFYAFRSIFAIVLGGFFASETTNSLDFNPALKVVNCTLSSASSTSRVSRVKRFPSEAFHVQLQGFFLPLLDGEQVVCWSLRALSSDEVVQKGVTQLLEAVDG